MKKLALATACLVGIATIATLAAATGLPKAPANADVVSKPTASDATALGILAAINQNEIDVGKQAQSKGVSAPVLAYARKMIDEHGQNLRKTQELGARADSAEARDTRNQGKSELAALAGKSGKDYETAYVDAMVTGHEKALATLDDKLLPMAQSSAVKAHLSETQMHVSAHLDEAKNLQSSR